MLQNTKKVYVGMSGGVDSAVAASLLKKEDFDVLGVFIKIWHPTISNCDWKAEMRDAMRVCAHLAIPFKMIDLSDLYFEKVIGYMLDEYKHGRTPNPDVMCNEVVKFGAFYDWAITNGADYIATGHYAQIVTSETGYYMKQGIDEGKDQTYFLWRIKKEQLERIFFPIGKFTKQKIRSIAEKIALPNANKRDSQGLCFIGDINVKQFIKNNIKVKPGVVLTESGEIIGEHDGAILYTVGERHGFKTTTKNAENKPYFVVTTNYKNNTITVTNNYEELTGATEELQLSDVNLFVTKEYFTNNNKIFAMCRYHAPLQLCTLYFDSEKDGVVLKFKKPQEKIAKGQSVVFYDESGICLGGSVVS